MMIHNEKKFANSSQKTKDVKNEKLIHSFI